MALMRPEQIWQPIENIGEIWLFHCLLKKIRKLLKVTEKLQIQESGSPPSEEGTLNKLSYLSFRIDITSRVYFKCSGFLSHVKQKTDIMQCYKPTPFQIKTCLPFKL